MACARRSAARFAGESARRRLSGDVRLDSTDAEIALRDAEARLARAVRQTRTVFANRDQLEAVASQRQADVSKAQSDLDRRKHLTASGAVSAEELAHARDTLRAARTDWWRRRKIWPPVWR